MQKKTKKKFKHSCGTILSLFKLPEGRRGAGIKVHRWVGRRPSQTHTRFWAGGAECWKSISGLGGQSGVQPGRRLRTGGVGGGVSAGALSQLQGFALDVTTPSGWDPDHPERVSSSRQTRGSFPSRELLGPLQHAESRSQRSHFAYVFHFLL